MKRIITWTVLFVLSWQTNGFGGKITPARSGWVKEEAGSEYPGGYCLNDSAKTFLAAGLARKDSGDCLRAIDCFTLAINLDPRLCAAYLNRAHCEVLLLDYKRAIDDYTRALLASKNWEESFEACYNRGLTLATLENLEDAMADLDFAIRLNPEYADAYYNRSIIRGKLGDYTGELIDINKVIDLRPTDAYAFNSRGIVRSIKGDYAGALKDFNQSITLNSKNGSTYFNRALVLFELKQYSAALSDFDMVIRIKPDAETYNRRGNVKRRMQDSLGAINDYTAALTLEPKYYVAWFNRGSLEAEMRDYNAAIDDFTKALKVKPDYSIAYYNRGLAREKLSEWKEAIADFSSAIEYKPDYEEAYFERGLVKYKLDEKIAGCDDLNKAAKLGSNDAYEFIVEHCE